jgi:hypothetical protein
MVARATAAQCDTSPAGRIRLSPLHHVPLRTGERSKWPKIPRRCCHNYVRIATRSKYGYFIDLARFRF